MESLLITQGMQRIFRSQNIGIINGYEDKYSKTLGLECNLLMDIANGRPYELSSQKIRRIAWVLDVRMDHIIRAISEDIKRGIGKVTDFAIGDNYWKIFKPEHIPVA